MRKSNTSLLKHIQRKYKIILKIIVILTLLVLVFIVGIFTFRVSRVEIVGPSVEINDISYFNNKLIFLINIHEVSQHIVQNNPQIKTVDVVKAYPHTLRIRIERSEIVAKIKITDGIMHISEGGRVLSKNIHSEAVDDTYTMITSSHQYFLNQFPVGSTIEQKEIKSALFFLDKVGKELLYKVENIDIVNENMIVLHTGNYSFIFTVNKDNVLQIEELKLVIKRLGSKMNEIEKIDVRFEKPLLSYIKNT